MVEAPQFVKSFGARVGFVEDNTWVVLWQQPDKTLVSHLHRDVWSVLEQNERVIRQFLGLPIEGGQSSNGPKLSISLPDLHRRIMIKGETQKAQSLALNIANLMSLSTNEHTPMQELQQGLRELEERLGPKVRAERKVKALGHLMKAAQAPSILEMHRQGIASYENMILRAGEGMSITRALMNRAVELLIWTEEQENTLRSLRNNVGAALLEMGHGRRLFLDQEMWYITLFGTDLNPYTPVTALRGNPYWEISQRREIKHLGDLKPMMQQTIGVGRNPLNEDQLRLVKRRFEQAYKVLDTVVKERDARHKSGKWDRYL